VVVRAVAGGEAPTRVGFVVGKRVGNAVIRNSVKRRLRHLAAAELPGVRTGYDVVVRALPGAADSRAALVSDFRRCWRAALNRADKRAMAR
jgi:ribonuclease P protein component